MQFFFFKKDPGDRKLVAFIRDTFGFTPSRLDLYHQALLHKSSIRDEGDQHIRSNERLEFLGDAILDSVVAELIYHHYPQETEGELTKLKSKIVKRETLNLLAEKLGFDQQVKLTRFGINTPKSILGNAFEAFIGAMFLDKGYEFTRKVIRERILSAHIDLEEIRTRESDYKSKVLIWSQKEKRSLEFVLIREENRGAEMLYEVEIRVDQVRISIGSGGTKKEAEQLAARDACLILFSDGSKESE